MTAGDETEAGRFTQASLEAGGFVGWCRFADLAAQLSSIPREAGGVYVVFRPMLNAPKFLAHSPAGTWRGDPTTPIDELTANRVDGALVLYIGKANPGQLRIRLRTYRSLGSGGKGRHYGGRYVWQLDGIWDCLVAWRITGDDETPRLVEAAMIQDFVSVYGKRPFANLVH